MFIVKWEAATGNSIDWISPSLFADEGVYSFVEHETRWDGREVVSARAALTVAQEQAILYYGGAHRKYNEALGIDIGSSLLEFSYDRTVLKGVAWSSNSQTFEPRQVEIIDDSEVLADEGNPVLVTHYRRERDTALRTKKFASVTKPACEVCLVDLGKTYGKTELYEIHHRDPLAKGPRKVALIDLAILCPNCHRAIHKTFPIKSVADFAAEYAARIQEA